MGLKDPRHESVIVREIEDEILSEIKALTPDLLSLDRNSNLVHLASLVAHRVRALDVIIQNLEDEDLKWQLRQQIDELRHVPVDFVAFLLNATPWRRP